MLELGKLYIPTILSYNPVYNRISLERPEFQTFEYFINVDYSLQLSLSGDEIFIMYYGEDDTYLADTLNLENFHIAEGNLNTERFGKIQERALKVLGDYILDSQKELLDLFNEKHS